MDNLIGKKFSYSSYKTFRDEGGKQRRYSFTVKMKVISLKSRECDWWTCKVTEVTKESKNLPADLAGLRINVGATMVVARDEIL